MDKIDRLHLKKVHCFLEPDIYDVEEDDIDLVIINNKDFLEISKGKVSISYSFNCPVSSVNKIAIYYSYNPKFKYYLISLGSELIVLRKSGQKLDLFRHIFDVADYFIDDYYDIGRPHVIISKKDKSEPIITDFSGHPVSTDKEKEIKTLNRLNFAVVSQINAMAVRIKNTENLLKDKKCLIAELCYSLIDNLAKPAHNHWNNNLVCAYGVKQMSNTKNLERDLLVKKPVLKVLSGNWVVIFPIRNISDNNITTCKMYIAHKDIIVQRTLLFLTHEDNTVAFSESAYIQSKSDGFLIGVLEEVHFIKTSVKLQCMALYNKADKVSQCYLGELFIQMRDMLLGKFRLFNDNMINCDILTIKSIYVPHLVAVRCESINSLIQILHSLQFSRVGENCFMNSSSSSHFNITLICLSLEEDCNILQIYTQHTKLIMLLHEVQELLPKGVRIQTVPCHFASVVNSLQEEFQFIKLLLIQEVIENSGCNISFNGTNEKLQQLANLELFSTKCVSKWLDESQP